MKKRFALIGLMAGMLFLSGCRAPKTVSYVDIPRYMGLWYQIAAYETFFNEGLEGVTAEYTLLEDGTVEVYNSGYVGSLDGPFDDIYGNAEVLDTETNAKLKVTFPEAVNLPYANYLIIILDEDDYSYAVVSDPLKYTLFILSRTPQMDEDVYTGIISELEDMGFDTGKLITTQQP